MEQQAKNKPLEKIKPVHVGVLFLKQQNICILQNVIFLLTHTCFYGQLTG